MKKLLALSVTIFACFGSVGCSSDDADNGGDAPSNGGGDSKCLASALTLTETNLLDSPTQNAILVDFDVKNSGTVDYDVVSGSAPIMIAFKVTTVDGMTYEDEGPLTATKVSAGGTATAKAMATYGAGKTYQSYTTSLRCR